jgi:hypothetical protein
MKTKALKLKDRDFGRQWSERVEDRWNYDDFLADRGWREDWISFDGVAYHARNKRVYCGLTSFDGDIFKAYDRERGGFVDLDFRRVGNKYDAKFHRSMQFTRDQNTLYVATALLHDVDRHFDAPGGSIYRHDVSSGTTTKFATPLPHSYIQSIALDEKRGFIYCMHYPPECLTRFDLATQQVRNLGPIGSGMSMAQGENLVQDDDGGIWCGWGAARAWQSASGADCYRLCRYDPSEERIMYLKHGLPRPDGQHGFARVEGLFNLGTGCLYASGGNGSLYRLNHRNGEMKYLGTPIADRRSRLSSLAMHRDGWAYGIAGRDGLCRLLRFNPANDTYELGDAIVDAAGVAMWQCHDVTVTPDGVLYAAENDHPQRSSYLWEIQL